MRRALFVLVLLLAFGASAQTTQKEIITYLGATPGEPPLPCPPGYLIQLGDDTSAGGCDPNGGGAFKSLCICDPAGTGYDSSGGGGTGSPSLPVPDSTYIVEGSGDPSKKARFEVDGFAGAANRVLTVPDEDIDLHDSQTDHEERYGLFRPEDYGAIKDDGLDDTAAFIAAFAACNAHGVGGVGTVKLSVGDYELSDTAPFDEVGIDFAKQCAGGTHDGDTCSADPECTGGGLCNVAADALPCNMEGSSPDTTQSVIEWDNGGIDGIGSVFRWNMGTAGEFTTFAGIEFRNDVDAPRRWLSIRGLDRFSIFKTLKFGCGYGSTTGWQCTGIHLDGWVNASIEWLRCDGMTWCVEADYCDGCDGSNLSIDTFTADNSNVDGTTVSGYGPHGFIKFACSAVDDGQCGATNAGTALITNGRLEFYATENGHQFAHDNENGGAIAIMAENVTSRQNAGTPPNCVFSLNPDGTPSPTTFSRMNVQGKQVSLGGQLLCGWGDNYYNANLDEFTLEQASNDLWAGQGNAITVLPSGTSAAVRVLQNPGSRSFCTYNQADADSADISSDLAAGCIMGDGDIRFSSDPGTGDLDVQIGAVGADELGLAAGDDFCLEGGAQCIRYDATATCLYYDANNDDTCDLGEELSANCTACP